LARKHSSLAINLTRKEVLENLCGEAHIVKGTFYINYSILLVYR